MDTMFYFTIYLRLFQLFFLRGTVQSDRKPFENAHSSQKPSLGGSAVTEGENSLSQRSLTAPSEREPDGHDG